jgi:hypothetical protein
MLCYSSCCQAKHQLLQEEHSQLLAAKSAPTSAAAAAGDASCSADQQLQQQQLMLSMAADNARLAVALAELMEDVDRLQGQQQQTGSTAAVYAEAPEVNQQRLQLLVSQLVVARDQAAEAANLSEQQQEQLTAQQQQLAQAAAELAAVQQQHAQLQRQHLQQAQAAVVAAVMAAAEQGSPSVAQVRCIADAQSAEPLRSTLFWELLLSASIHQAAHPHQLDISCETIEL